jgi:hypothetical protein
MRTGTGFQVYQYHLADIFVILHIHLVRLRWYHSNTTLPLGFRVEICLPVHNACRPPTPNRNYLAVTPRPFSQSDFDNALPFNATSSMLVQRNRAFFSL